MVVNNIPVRFKRFDSWLKVNDDLVRDFEREFPTASPAQIERLLLRFYRNQLLTDRQKLLRFVNSCVPGELSRETRKSKGKEVFRNAM